MRDFEEHGYNIWEASGSFSMTVRIVTPTETRILTLALKIFSRREMPKPSPYFEYKG